MLMPLAILGLILGVITAPGLIAQHLEERRLAGMDQTNEADA